MSGQCSALLNPDRNYKDLPYAEPGEVLTSSGPSWHCRHYISLTAVLEFGPTETLPPVGAISKHPGVSADAIAKPSAQTRAESRVLDLRKRLRKERQTVCWREMDSNHRYPQISLVPRSI